MKKLLLAFFVLLLFSCSDKVNDDYSVYSIDYKGGRFIDQNRIAFNINYNIPPAYFKENYFYILSWNKIGSKGKWNGFIADSLKVKSGTIELISDLSLIKSDLTSKDTLMFMFSLERKESDHKTIQIKKSQVIYFSTN